MIVPPFIVMVDTDREKRLVVNVRGHGGRIEVWWERDQPHPLFDSKFNDDMGRPATSVEPMIVALFGVKQLLERREREPPWHSRVIDTLPESVREG